MSEQPDLPDWIKALRPPEPAEEAPPPSPFDSLRAKAAAAQPAFVEETVAAEPAPPSPFADLREKAAAPLPEPEEERASPLQDLAKNLAILQVYRSLKAWQRFTLSLFVFLNVSMLGCFLLLVLGRIDPMKIMGLFGVR